MNEVPGAGDTFNAVADERMARELVEERKQQAKEKTLGVAKKVTLDDLFAHPAGRDKGLQHHRQGGRPGQRRGRQDLAGEAGADQRYFPGGFNLSNT